MRDRCYDLRHQTANSVKYHCVRNILLSITLLLSMIFNALDAAQAAKTEIEPEISGRQTPISDDGKKFEEKINAPETVPTGAKPDSSWKLKLESVDVATPPARKANSPEDREYVFSYHYQLGATLGQISSSVTTNGTNIPQVYGVQFSYADEAHGTYEFAANLLSQGMGSLDLARCFDIGESRLRAFAKAGLSLEVDPQDQIAIFVNIQHLRLLSAVGAEYFFAQQTGIKMEIGTAFNTSEFETSIAFGLVVAW